MSYYKLYRQPAEGKAVRGLLVRIDEKVEVPICSTLENVDYLIPALIYRLSVTISPKYGRLMPIICNVPNRSGIRIHRGFQPEHSKGCILVRDLDTERKITNELLKEQNNHEEIRLEIN